MILEKKDLCWEEDLNLHALRHSLLKTACIPISPSQHIPLEVIAASFGVRVNQTPDLGCCAARES